MPFKNHIQRSIATFNGVSRDGRVRNHEEYWRKIWKLDGNGKPRERWGQGKGKGKEMKGRQKREMRKEEKQGKKEKRKRKETREGKNLFYEFVF